jgi:nicotinamidase-related amidase
MGEWAEEDAAEFDAIEPAVDWIKNHREEILVGTVIVIAGVAFTVVVAASAGGALILVPVVFLVEDSSGQTQLYGSR